MAKKFDLGGIHKEFIPVFLILVTPMLAFMNGFGIKTASVGIDLYYVVAVLFGFIMTLLEKNRISHKYEFLLLIALEIAINIPYMKEDNYFNGNYTYLVISYTLIMTFLLLAGVSFAMNKPYFVDYYATKIKHYLVIYRIVAVFFFGMIVYHAYLFSKVIDILKMTYK